LAEHASFGVWLRQQRKARDLTQEDLGTRVGCSADAIRKIELGERRPSREIAGLIATYFGVPSTERAAFVQFARTATGVSQSDLPRGLPRDPQGPWRQRPWPPTNLPRPLTRLIGRDPERAILNRLLLGETRLLTLTGTPGVGKTRLGLQVACDLHEHFRDGVFLIRLAPVGDPARLASTMATTLGLSLTVNQPITEILANYLREKQLLLVLDNCEHLLDGMPLVSELLQQCAELRVLATSREPLRLYGEHRFLVSPLALPPCENLPRLQPPQLCDYAAIALFDERARAVQFAFTLDTHNAGAVVEICQRLDGLPLAIELAAARVADLPPQEILPQLNRRLALLVDGDRDVPERHQTLRNAIAWSYDLLSPEEQRLFQWLGVFVGGAAREALTAILVRAGWQAERITRDLEALLGKHLVEGITAAGETSRYGLLETLREYALEQLARSGEEEVVRAHHLAYFLMLAEEAEPRLTAADQIAWLDQLESEQDNLRAALRWAHTHAPERGLQLAGALAPFWRRRGPFAEGRRWVADLRAAAPAPPLPLRAKAVAAAALLEEAAGDDIVTQRLAEESMALHQQVGDEVGAVRALIQLVHMAVARSEIARANALAQESLARAQATGDQATLAAALFRLAHVVAQDGDYARAHDYLVKCLALNRALGDRRSIAMTINNLGMGAMQRGDLATARQAFEESRGLWQELRDQAGLRIALINLADIALREGAYPTARDLLDELAAIDREQGDAGEAAGTLIWQGILAQAHGDYEIAAQHYTASLRWMRERAPHGADIPLRLLGLLALDQNDPARAAPLLRESLTLCPEWNQPDHLAAGLAGLGAVAGAQGDPIRAARLFGAADAVHHRAGTHFLPWEGAALRRYETAAWAQLPAAAWETAYAAGQALTIAQARACALNEMPGMGMA
jgi:predicted ATPase/DNA-binding XRE family transcriptional regulator